MKGPSCCQEHASLCCRQAGGLWTEQLEEHRHLRNARGLWDRFYDANTNDLVS